MKIKVSEVFIPPSRQRTKINESAIAELSISIQAHGQFHPITVLEINEEYRAQNPTTPLLCKWRLIAGHRRLLATALLKIPEIEANLRDNLTDLEMAEIELDENLMRENLHYSDEVMAKKRLFDIRSALYGDSMRDLSVHLNESKGSTFEDIKLARAMEYIPDLAKAKNKSQAQNKLKLAMRRMELSEKAKVEFAELQSNPILKTNLDRKIHFGDCLEITKKWNPGIIGCVITDPPYGINLDIGQTKKDSNHPVVYDDNHYDIMDLTALIAKEAYRLLKEDAHAYFWFDIKAYDKVFNLLSSAGFYVEGVPIIWAKPGPGQVNHPDQRWASAYETCFFCRKGNRALLKQGQSNILNYDPVPPSKKIHPTEKPVALLRQLIETSSVTGEIILDFCGGSGSTAEAAIQTNRNFLICEKDQAYYQGICERIRSLETKTEKEEGVESSGYKGSTKDSKEIEA